MIKTLNAEGGTLNAASSRRGVDHSGLTWLFCV
jgi:hypothetical protein